MRQLNPEESKRLLKRYHVKVADSEVAETKNQAVKIAKKFGFPVVMKIVSPDIIHKTDAGGVKTDICSTLEVQDNFNKIGKNAKKHKRGVRIEGILVQKQLQGEEVIIGGKRDPQFGPVVLFGLGGIFVEVLKDVSIRVAPITRREALSMIKEIKAYPILEGIRGREEMYIEGIIDIITRIANLMLDHDHIMEMDLNPCFVNEDECVAGDFRILVEGR